MIAWTSLKLCLKSQILQVSLRVAVPFPHQGFTLEGGYGYFINCLRRGLVANVLGPCTAKVVQLLDYNGNEVLLRSYLDISLQNSYW